MSECTVCPAGKYCPRGSDVPLPCPRGSYCLIGNDDRENGDPVPCPAGTFGSREGLEKDTECTGCTPGHYCVQAKLSNVTGLCAAGYWCKTRAITATPSSSENFGPCPSGGYYCEAGSSAPQRCPVGRYAKPGRNQLKSADECDLCDAGHYCAYGNQTKPTGNCTPGYYCKTGSPVREPTNDTFGGKCFTGHRCPERSPWPTACAAGEYNHETGREICLDCPAGSFCTVNTTTPDTCPAGYYCPLNTKTSNENPCPAGTFSNLTSRTSLDDCQPCTPGSYCATKGLSSVTGLCDGGYFCSNRSISKTPGNLDEGGGPCQPGTYCPLGSPAPIQCPPGEICTAATLTNPDGDCFPGYYCTGGANVATPTGGIVGGRCPLGAYCPKGSRNYTLCPPGTYADTEGNVNLTQCNNCTARKFCKGWGNPSPEGDCDVGYYCPPGQAVPNPNDFICPEGHFCKSGSEGPTRCDSGGYQDEKMSGSCKVCPAGYYCDNRLSPVVLFTNSSCPVGHYCPAGTKMAYENKCPRGTFSNQTGLENVTQCSPCPGGFYCPEFGQSTFSLYCNAGYYCRSGAYVGTPEDHPENTTICQPGSFNFSDAGPCPEGRFCQQGTAEPEKCPPGTYNNRTKLQSKDECTNCTEGMFCMDYGLTKPSGKCRAGYYCPSGADRHNYLECPAGSFCVSGSVTGELCPNGTYRNVTEGKNRDDCFECTPGLYCDGVGLEKPSGPCGAGYYCPSGSKYVKPPGFQCRVGHYCPGGDPEPIPCRNNSYVNYTGAVQCEPCPAGFYCVIAGTTVICPEGYYCPAGTGKDLKSCPRGTYGPEKGYYEVAQCKPCKAGMYCGQEHMMNVTTKCSPGHWCAYGVDRPQPVGRNLTSLEMYNKSCPHYDGKETGYGGICPLGTYCPEGSPWPKPCASGSYAPETGLSKCKECMEGYYCPENQSSYDSFPCPRGYYCPNGTEAPYENPCKPGTYNSHFHMTKEEDCVACSPGNFCPEWGMVESNKTCEEGYYCRQSAESGTPNQGTDANICPEGHYCLNGTGEPSNCPKGTLNNRTGLKKEDECETCPAGYYCSEAGANTTSGLCAPAYYCPPGSVTKQQESCPEGKYCPGGSEKPELCPTGTYQPNKRQDNINDCLPCTEGFFCAAPGLANYTGPCANGSYCPTNSTISTPYDCPKGFHCPQGSPRPKPCPAGKFTNSTSTSECEVCPPGYFCLPLTWSGAVKNDSKGYEICSAGFYCPEGTGSDLRPCKAGTFSNRTRLFSQTQCTDCTPGFYCDGSNLTAPSGPCAPGYYCTSGVAVSQPYIGSYNSTNYTCPLIDFLGQYIGIGDICPEGHHCPGETPRPFACGPGTYNDEKGQRNCKNCPDGYYCLSGTVSFTNNTCPSGHYCLNNTSYARQYPCKAGTYNALTEQRSESSCTPCTPGMYCEGNGLSWPTGPCSAGWYCNGSATRNMTTAHGGQCQPGYYCPSRSDKMEPCSGGSFCETAGLSLPTGNCTAGYYCTLGANVSTPNDGIAGGRCPPGYYCPTGSAFAVPCEPGYYLDSPGAIDKRFCKSCQLGKFCNGTGLEIPTGNCSSGYYCPGGQASGTPVNHSCPVGHYCLEGDSKPRPCPSGMYQNGPQESSCIQCPKKFYCNATYGPVVNFNPNICPQGYYCPPGTKFAEEYPCEIGTFNNLTGRASQTECTQCLGKYYCGQPGLTYPNTLCAAGYYCKQGAKTSTPSQGEDANICPRGYYCEEGTDESESCPAGTFSNISGLKNSSSCTPCTEGYFCKYPGWTNETALCQEGFYCPKFSTSPQQIQCPSGSYCPTGSHLPKLCPRGTFSNKTELWLESQCSNCTAGYFCDSEGKSSPTGKCKAGYYCPIGSKTMEQVDCPIGFHCPEGSKTPRDCPSGSFTNTSRSSICQECPERYYCIPNNVTAGDPQSGYHACPRGYYCPPGTGLDWKSCPKGSYSNSTGLSMESECEPCDGGFYCDKLNATKPTAHCHGGYYCESGVDRPDPIHSGNVTNFSNNCGIYGYHTGFGGICPVGYYCPQGSVTPVGCPDGSYQDQPGKTYCKSCPAGYYCQNNASSYVSNECPVGHYCLLNTTQPKQFPCPPGTFNPKTAQTNRSACINCTPGMYCEGTGNEYPTDKCSAGWYCSGGATVFQPPGGRCLPGYYCPNGSSSPRPCDPGYYCMTDELSKPTHECEAGSYCTSFATYPQPNDNTTGNICPKGSYCPRGSKAPERCPIGTFLNTTGNRNITDCQDCIYGWYCGGSGLPNPTDHCDRGYYCDGRATKKDWKPCPKGHKCSGRDQPQKCPAGFYQNEFAMPDCKPCEPGYFCKDIPVTNYTSYECPAGYYCPRQTESATQFPCPLGKFNNLTKRRDATDCIPCTGGYACDRTGLTFPYKLCSAGYFCRRGSNSTTPNLGKDADVCPPGYYCPEGTDQPRECPIGTFRSTEAGQIPSDCQICTGGDVCNRTAMTATSGPCDAGFYCKNGSSNSQQIACPEGRYCEQGTHHPKPCPAGTFSNATMGKASSDCTQCTSGSYCETEGLTKPTGYCEAGYYCPRGSSNKTTIECPIGTHCPMGSAVFKYCSAGLYTDYAKASICHVCPEGFYCLPENVKPGDILTVKTICPPGYFCPNGTGWGWRACPPGTYDAVGRRSEERECTPCDPGKFCRGWNLTAPNGECQQGYYCSRGAAVPNPVMTNLTYCPAHFVHVTVGDICPRGHFCPKGSDMYKGCVPGTYNDEEGQHKCKDCPSGYYCLANTTDYISFVCPKGYYCPSNTPNPSYKQCPPGTYNDLMGGQNISACQECTPGYYCSGWGKKAPTNSCSPGWYCPGGNNESRPSEYGCQPGFYCPLNSSRMTPCDEGKYCEKPIMSEPGDLCGAGYYCPLQSTTAIQEDCPPGNFCPIGSKYPTPCDPGTYLPGGNHVNQSECIECTAGMHCDRSGLGAPSGMCAEKYYCPTGQSSSRPTQYYCPPGHYCQAGFPEPKRCGNGTYQPNNYSTSCLICEEGYYCDNTNKAVYDLTGLKCPEGHYCPRGTKFATEFPCLSGTWSKDKQLVRAEQCFKCPQRYYCQRSGLTSPQDLCFPGFYCDKNGTQIPNPPDGECPRGYYCPRGSYLPVPCPRGSYTNSTGNGNMSDCKPCSRGKYCDPNAGVMKERDCDPGFVCLTGSTVPNPVNGSQGYQCPTGHYCPAGIVKEEPCPPTKYAPKQGLATCLPCPQGKICPNYTTIIPQPCPVGHYCTGGNDGGEPCPAGTYRRGLSARYRNECLSCDAGSYCDRPGLDKPSGPCSEGYLCLGGATLKTPNDLKNRRCLKGKYCINGTTHAELCPEGTMRNTDGGAKLADCTPCRPGKFCATAGLYEPSGECDPGYYCPEEAPIKVSAPEDYRCPPGHYCPLGTADPKGCDPGLYQPNKGNDTCFTCPFAKFCLGNTSIPEVCPSLSYCPGGTIEPIFCPNGTYTNENTTGLYSATQCSPCTVGHFCQRGDISGECSAGYLCYQGNPTPTPDGSDKTIGERCPYGFYCPAGAIDKVACSRGLVIDKSGAKSAADCALCPAGKICSENNTLAVACTVGFYCPYNATMKPCPVGTYSDTVGATNSSSCHPCPAGYWCNRSAMSDFRISPCPVGFFCNEAIIEPTSCPDNGTYRNSTGAGSIEECLACPRGYICPINPTVSPIACLNGTYCPPGSVEPRICQPGFYCPRSMYELACPVGFYCPLASSYPLQCPLGYYCDPTLLNGTGGVIKPSLCPKGYEEILGSHRQTLNDTCQICKPGQFNDDPSKHACRKCKAGVICFEGATTDEPHANNSLYGVQYTKSFPCPVGYYCESGDIIPTPCPNKTYNPVERGSRMENCLPCKIDHYNHLTGQSACFHCGGQARQPYFGQDRCQCNGLHRVFMPSDQTCLCEKGFRAMEGRELDCVRKLYPFCPEATWRSQAGDCLDSEEWRVYCTSVCDVGNYVGFDRQLGLCTCRVDDLEDICDKKCRRQQENRLEHICASKPYLQINRIKGGPIVFDDLESFSNIPNFLNTFSKDQCAKLDSGGHPFNLVEMGDNGFLGTYDPSADFIEDILIKNRKDDNSTSPTGAPSSRRRRSLLAVSTSGNSLSGISNPTTCVNYGASMMFVVDNDNYPEYDENNLYNTNPDFDSGPFRDLKERHALMNTNSTLFTFKFDSPGVYVFRSSKYPDYKMYVRVMARGAQCAEDGPFFSTTPRSVIQNGMAISQDILIMPDWLLIGLMMASLLLLMIILVIGLLIFRKHGWRKMVFISPKYRKLNTQYNFDDYSSKGSAVHPSKKLHRNLYAIDGAPAIESEPETSQAGIGHEMRSDEFWDYEKQVDLEAFSCNEFYSILSKQSRDVTSSIARQKDQAKELYQKVNQQTESLRGLWVAKLNLRGRSAIASPEDLQLYENKRKELDDEVERRKDLGFTFQQLLRKELDILNEDEKGREEHQISFSAAVSETMRVLNGLTESTTSLTHLDRQRVNAKVDALLQDMTVEVTSECQRRGTWALLGQMTGAQLCTAEGETLRYNDIFDADGNLLSDDLVELDPHTGLFVPRDGACNMMLADNFTVVPIPDDFFVHPKTAKVMPIEGNVVYDSVTTHLVVTADNANDDTGNLSETPIPYIPYPVNPDTGKPVKNNFIQPTKPSEIKYGDPTNDPKTGLIAPILGVTIHPETAAIYPVGGCQESPVTGLPVPIELGSMMFDPKTDQPVPVVSITIDPRSGFVIPIGGNMTESGKGEEVPVIMGEAYLEPLSGNILKVTGARLIDEDDEKELESMGGGYPNALDVCELYHESRVIDAVREWKEAAAGHEALSGRHEKSILETRLKELSRSKVKVKTHLLRHLHAVLKREEQTTVLMESGGCPGTYEYYATGQLLPILVGTTMRDMSGSGLEVPILGIDKDPENKEVMPLGGSLEDPHGNGLVPIMLGEKAVDPVTEEMSTICGVKLNKDLKITEPVTLSSSLKKKRKAHPTLLSILEEEYVARRSFWRRQRHRERELSEQHTTLRKQILDNYDITLNLVSEQMELINEGVSSLSDAEHREAQRRGDANIEQTASLPPFIVHWITRLDHPEKEREESHQGALIRFVDVIERFFAKLQAEETKYRARMDELEGALNPDAEASVTERHYQLKDRLRSELEDQLQTRTEQLDQEHAALEYVREKAELLLSEAKLILGGEGAYTGDFSLLLNGIYGDDIQLSEANSELIPLLKRVIALLQENGISLSATRLPPGYPTGVSVVAEERPGRGMVTLQKDESSLPASVIVHEAPVGKDSVHTSVPSQARIEPGRIPPSTSSQEPTKPSMSADQIFNNLQVNQLGETFSGGDVSVSEIAATGEWNEEKRREIGKNLREKHTLECVEHENELRAEEIKAIQEVLEEYQEKKNAKVDELRNELRENLRQATSSEQREAMFEEYSRKMEEAIQTLESEKEEKMKEVRQRLKRERLRKKKELYNRHKEEARRAGIEHVVDLDLPSDDKLEQDLIQLAREQERLLTELQRAYADEDAELRDGLDTERKAKLDADMEALARAMSTLVPTGDVQDAINEIKEASGKIAVRQQDLKEKMRTKREKRRAMSGKGVRLTSDEEEALRNVDPGSDVATSIVETAKLRESSKERNTENAIYNVLAEIEEDELENTKAKVLNDLLSKTAMSEEEKRSFIAKFFEQAAEAKEKMDSTREYNQAVLAAKIAARRRMKESLAKEKAMKDEVSALSKKQARMSKDADTVDVLETTEELMKESLNEKMESLEEEQTVRLEEMEVEHKKDVIHMEEELKNATNRGMSSIEQQMEQQKQKMIAAEKEKFEKDLSNRKFKDKLSEEQVQQLMSEHAESMAMLSRNINIEKDRQLNSLASKIAERRKIKAAILARKHEAEVAKELVKQREERNEVEDDQIAETRKKVLTEKVGGMASERAENTIFHVLQQHHIQQKIQLEEQFRSEIKASQDEARAMISEQRQQEKDGLVAAHEREFIELFSNPEGLTPNQLAQKKAELKIRHKRELDQFDKDTDAQLNETDNHVEPSLEVKHAHERLRLRERQLQELSGTMTDLMTKEELSKSYEEDAERAAQNAKEFQERTTFAISEKINQLKETRRKQSVTQKENMDDEIRRMEKELEKEREREALRLAERETERECRKRKQSEEREAKRKLEIAQRGQAEPEKERLLKEHEANMAKFQKHLQSEQERMKAALKEKLEARRRKRKESGIDNAEIASPKGEGRMNGVQLARHESTAVSSTPSSQTGKTAPTMGHTTSASGSPVVTIGLPENMSENDWLSLLISSPVFERVNEIEELLNQGIIVGGNAVLGASRGRPYIDLKDAQWLCSGDLMPVDINELSPANFVVYRFGVFVTQLLENRMNVPSVTLLLASNLPPNNYDNNAFRHSFFYEHSRQILFVREERLHSVGDFVVVIMHCLAHILVDDLSDDQNPLFLRAFYKAMRICCQDLFFARARSTDAAHTLVNGATTNGKSPLEKAFQHVTSMPQRTNVVSELVNIKVTSINDVDYSPKAINRRVIDQNSYMDKAKLRGYLATLHGPTKSTKEFAATRLQQLRGTKKDTSTTTLQRANQRARSHFKTPKDLILAQLNELQRHLDVKNAELVQVVNRESQLLMSVSEEQQSNKDLVKNQLDGFTMKKELLAKKIAFIEDEITKKKKEAGLL